MVGAPYPTQLLANTLRAVSEEPYHEYWYKLGKFVHQFAQAEGRLLCLVRQVAGIQDPISGLVLSGLRQEAARDLLNRILDATDQQQRKDRLQRPLEQLATIATIRNNIIHWGAIHDGNPELLVSNTALGPTPQRLKEFRIHPSDLDNMCEDLERINVLIMTENNPSFPDDGAWGKYMRRPWLYKPPQPSPPKPPQAAQSRKRR